MEDNIPKVFRLLWKEDEDLRRLLRAYRPDLLEEAQNKPTGRDCEEYIDLCRKILESDIPGIGKIL